MPDLTISAAFTTAGEPATGLALADIRFLLTAQNQTTGVDTVIWDGSQNPTEEIDNIGKYSRILTNADRHMNVYHAAMEYTGGIIVDNVWVEGAI